MPGDKRSFEERLPHVLAVEKLLCSGAKESAILRTLGEKFGLTAKQVRQDIAAVRRRWAKKAGGAADAVGSELGRSLDRLEQLYSLALKAGDLPTALAVERQRCKLLGLYPSRTVVILKPKHATASEMTDAELELVARRGLDTNPVKPSDSSERPEPEEVERVRPPRHRRRAGRSSSRRRGRVRRGLSTVAG